MITTRPRAAVWFGRVTWLGILANVALALPTVLIPGQMLAMANLPPATPLMWVRFAGVLLILLSLFYMPAAHDPYRYRAPAWLAVLSRLTGVLFFATQPAVYRMFGLFDLTFLVPEALLLFIIVRDASSGAWAGGLTS